MTKGHYIDEKCPRCQTRLIGNNLGEKWCGHLTCDYGVVDYTKKGMTIKVKK
jgi:phage FluMu protein Com